MNSTASLPTAKPTASLRDLAAEIAAHLPGTWTAKAAHSDSTAYLARADGLTLFLAAGGYRMEGQLEVSLNRPRDTGANDSGWVYVYEGGNRVDDPRIKAALTKTAEQLARDIERRLLPDAERVFALVSAQIARSNAHRATRGRVAQQLAAAIGQTVPTMGERNKDRDPSFSFDAGEGGRGHGSAKVSGDTVAFSLYSIPAEKAVELARFLTEHTFAAQ